MQKIPIIISASPKITLGTEYGDPTLTLACALTPASAPTFALCSSAVDLMFEFQQQRKKLY